MEQEAVKKNKNKTLKNAILITLIIMFALVITWHLLLPMLGITIAVSAGLWGMAVASIILICAATLLFFIFTGIGIFITGFFVLIWTIAAIALFPLLFPILIPVLLLMFLVGYFLRSKKK
ncbi:MAG: hypothetical protein COY58_03050 [Gammaproteobacteria bacterium CG_4_10_14_0_8_um_filter_38_16]|nr:MAG: hypothetical protein COY58_03050 [Gammaproteobacteria bacterium CG_4_10_14_0_8_um_filter_38_16]PJA03905.1 MAG: hypothetical protein COX72_03210 [Gammaproteobacteria bacterium CG_4_10_14_0_2_um_filter_38_22]PJB09574.1 MAG: hypothetical protein CO120_09370 [Gammaproteobacteria bacterium CG_4_9_14_3_um_filter_38_9]